MQPTHDKMPHRPHLPLPFRCIRLLDLRLAIFAKGKDARSSSPMDHVASPPSPLPPIIVLHFFQVVIAASIVGVGARAMCLLAGFNRPSLLLFFPLPFLCVASALLSSNAASDSTSLEVNVTNVGNERERGSAYFFKPGPIPGWIGDGPVRCGMAPRESTQPGG